MSVPPDGVASRAPGTPPRYLVTGATGMVGRRLVEALRAAGSAVATLGRRAHGDELEFWRWDAALDEEAPANAEAWRPDVVVHAAAMTDVDGCEADPVLAQRINAGGTHVVAGLAGRCGARLVYLSTDSVFDGRRGGYRDDDQPAPLNVYARTKLAGEVEARRVPGALVLRTNVVGPERLTGWILDSAVRGKAIRVFTDVVFNPVEVSELAGIVPRLCEAGLTGTVHLGADEAISKAEYAERLVARAGLSGRAALDRVRLADEPLKAPRPLDTSLVMSARAMALVPVPRLDAAITRLATTSTVRARA